MQFYAFNGLIMQKSFFWLDVWYRTLPHIFKNKQTKYLNVMTAFFYNLEYVKIENIEQMRETLNDVIAALPEWCWVNYLAFIFVQITQKRTFAAEFQKILHIVANAFPETVFYAMRGLYHKQPLISNESSINDCYRSFKKTPAGLVFKRTNQFFKRLIHSIVTLKNTLMVGARSVPSQNLHL